MTFSHPDFVPHYLAAYALLRRDGKFFFMRRANVSYMNGYYGLPSGKVDAGEPITQCLVRETFEETGVTIDPAKAVLCHITHRYEPDQTNTKQWVDFYYIVDEWQGEPEIKETNKADHAAWLDADSTENIVPYLRPVIKAALQGQIFSLAGAWSQTYQNAA